jgi:serine/threonine protein kinase
MTKVKSYREWEILKSLGEGGQGFVYLVKKKGDSEGKQFVLKRLKNINRIERFQKEIETIIKFDHDNIVRYVDSDLTSDPPYLVMEYCKNGSLDKYDLSRYSLLEKLELFESICKGFAYAHDKNIVHRDIKPSNIFMNERSNPVIGDFGICFVDDAGERFTTTEEIVGPLLYIAPELEDGRLDEISTTSDVYSLGKLLYWLVASKIFNREKHRDTNYDLTKSQKGENYLLYELLDKMITSNIKMRLKNASEILSELEILKRRIMANNHVINITVPQHCIYCGKGNYNIVVHEQTKNWETVVSNFGFRVVGDAKWNIFVCDHCGNVQIFRSEKAKNKDIWKNPTT